ncbi:unnamed protein product, partial [Ixodes persulcatus]
MSTLAVTWVLLSHLEFSFTTKPNIVIVTVDDLGWADVGFHGSRQIPVPNIDALAADGVILNKYYAQPWPLSSRIGLLTGIYPYRTGNLPQSNDAWSMSSTCVFSVRPSTSLAHTHKSGLWNLGFYKKRFTPVNRGFDTAYAKWTGPGDYWTHDMETKMQGFDLRLNDDLMWNQTGVYSTRLFTERADPTREQCFFVFHQPLLLILSHQALHTANYHGSLQCPLEHLDSFGFIRDRKRRIFAGALTEVDQSLGQIFEALHNRRLLNNTILVFASASGGMPVGDFTNNLSFNFPLRGMKGTYFEGGVRVPAFVWSPLLNKTRRTSTQLMHVTDWLPTLFSAAGGDIKKLGAVYDLDSVNMWEALSGDLKSPRTEIIHNIDLAGHNFALQEGNYKGIAVTKNLDAVLPLSGWHPNPRHRPGFPSWENVHGTVYKVQP